MSTGKKWHVEVAYASPLRQEAIDVAVHPGATVEQAIRLSGILELFPEIDLMRTRLGIFGEIASLQDRVHEHDRVEIYRPLIADPKEARRQRAEHGKKKAFGRRKL